MDDLLICKECKDKYKNVSVLDTEPVIDIITQYSNGTTKPIKLFKCKICGKWRYENVEDLI